MLISQHGNALLQDSQSHSEKHLVSNQSSLNTQVQFDHDSGSTLNLCTVALAQLSIFVKVTQKV